MCAQCQPFCFKSQYVLIPPGAGVQWSSFGEGVSVDDKFTMSHAIAMLLLDSFLYCVVTWYVTSVYPGQYGVPQPWHFPFKVSNFGKIFH